MTNAQIDSIVPECADAMIGAIQDRLGVTDGGVAAQYFCECAPEWEALQGILRGYVKTELNFKGADK